MLSSPATRGSKGERFRSGSAANPCQAQNDLVLARARETEKATLTPGGTHRTRFLEPFRPPCLYAVRPVGARCRSRGSARPDRERAECKGPGERQRCASVATAHRHARGLNAHARRPTGAVER
jgi:hypothetical protein